MKQRRVALFILSMTAALILIACGGSGGGGGGGKSSPSVKASEGTAASPVDITLDTPHNGTVNTESSFYAVTVTPGTVYDITISGLSDNADLYVYNNGTFGSLGVSSTNSGTSDESTTVKAGGSILYIEVYGINTAKGASFTLEVTEATPPTATAITSPYSSTVDTGYDYLVTTTTPGSAYEVTLTGLADNADLYIYNDDTYADMVCGSLRGGTFDESCMLIAVGTSIYIKVDGSKTLAGTAYTVNMTERPDLSGTATDITGLTPYNGFVDTSYSLFVNTSTPDAYYDISLTGLTDDADLYVFDNDGTFSVVSCISQNVGADSESCTVQASGSSMYIMVYGAYTASGADFTLDMTETTPPQAEGSSGSPVDISGSVMPIGETGLYNGTVDTSASYYVADVVPGDIYSFFISVGTAGDNVDLYVYDDDDTFSTVACASTAPGTHEDGCSIEASGNKMYIKVDGQSTSNGTFFKMYIDAFSSN